MKLYTAAITLILVMDPLGNIPIFLSALKTVDPKRYARVILRESFIAFLILTFFLFFGESILEGLHISGSALNIAGGIILFMIALQMIFPTTDENANERQFGEPFIVPLAVPLTAGPSALATVILFASKEPTKMPIWFLAVVIASLVFTIVMLCSRVLMKILGERGIIAMERLMGMILTTIAVQMFLEGLGMYFKIG